MHLALLFHIAVQSRCLDQQKSERKNHNTEAMQLKLVTKREDYNPGPRVGITFSTFDLLHAGHIMMLAEAKRQCDYLICGLQMDPTLDRPEKNAPTQTVVERYIQLRGCQYVDEIVPYSTEQ